MLRGIIQHDTLNEVNIRLSDGSKAFDYYGYTNIVFKVLKADGTSYIDSEGENVIATSPEDGIATVILKGQATAAAGLCQSVIEIYDGEEKMTTARFNYEVFESLDVDENAQSESQYPVFQNLLADLSALEKSLEEAEAKRVALETGYVARAEKAAEEAEKWVRASLDIDEGDYATRAELEAVRVGAAPAGYGLGEARIREVDYATLNTTTRAGWYMFYDTQNTIEGFNAGFIECKGYNQNITVACVQEFYAAKGLYPMLKRYLVSGGWSAWEYVNPTMALGVEYRTTERFLGKPVYAKVVNFGALPNSASKTFAHGISNIDVICHFIAVGKVGAESVVVNNVWCVNHCYATAVDIVISASEDLSAWKNCYCTLKYTKTTDT